MGRQLPDTAAGTPITSYERIRVTPISGALGAEIGGVDLSRPLDEDTFGEVRRAFLEHLVVCFPDQSLTPEQHKAFGRRFGTLSIHPVAPHVAGHPEILEVVKEPEQQYNFGGGWHADMTFEETPSLGSILYAREVPPTGGDTLFANMYLAYETLTDGLKRLIDGLTAVHSTAGAYGPDGPEATLGYLREQGLADLATSREVETSAEHPVVRRHPETGRRALFVNPAFTTHISGLSKNESRPLLRYLFEHATKPELTFRCRWQNGTVAFWDNRCTQHYALNDYPGQRRVAHRVTIGGDRPRQYPGRT